MAMESTQTTQLIGKGGVGLVMFHLARMNHEFVATTDRSDVGDLWVRLDGRLQALEVKSSRTDAWTVRYDQAARVDWFAFVNISTAGAWLVRKDRVLEECRGKRQASPISCRLSGLSIARSAEMALHTMAPAVVPPPKANRPDHVTGKWTIVRKRLASGVEKVYRYPRF